MALLSLAQAGHQAVAVVDESLSKQPLSTATASDAIPESVNNIELVAATGSSFKSLRRKVYSGCDRTLVIAPEMDGILQSTLKWCRKHGIQTCNAGNEFVLRASDKMATAKALRRHDIPHPPTRLLSRAHQRWLDKINGKLFSQSGQEPIWVVKPRWGVGCDGIVRTTSGKIPALCKRSRAFARSDDWVVQPWLPGRAVSRAAIFDNVGRPHWLPVTEQHLSITDTVRYCGGVVEPKLQNQMPELADMLARAARALGPECRGWIGFDFLFDECHALQPLTLIEINPRLTTSFVGLCAAGAAELAGSIVSACCGQPLHLPSSWQRAHFTVNTNATH